MPNEEGDQDRNDHNDDDADSRRSPPISVFYDNRSISHMRCRSFALRFAAYTHARQASTRSAGCSPMWPAIGLALSLATASIAFWRSIRSRHNFYESDVYGMTPSTHRVYALVCFLFAASFAASFVVSGIPVVPILGAYAVVAVFYLASFARGFSDEE
jgi:hypothetical protein